MLVGEGRAGTLGEEKLDRKLMPITEVVEDIGALTSRIGGACSTLEERLKHVLKEQDDGASIGRALDFSSPLARHLGGIIIDLSGHEYMLRNIMSRLEFRYVSTAAESLNKGVATRAADDALVTLAEGICDLSVMVKDFAEAVSPYLGPEATVKDISEEKTREFPDCSTVRNKLFENRASLAQVLSVLNSILDRLEI